MEPEKLGLFILIIHFLADFGLQTHEQAVGTSKGNDFFNLALFYHVGVYSFIWFIASLMIFDRAEDCYLFTFLTFAFHYVTDYFTSRIASKFFSKQDFHNGFVVVGADQMIHYITLWVTFKSLM